MRKLILVLVLSGSLFACEDDPMGSTYNKDGSFSDETLQMLADFNGVSVDEIREMEAACVASGGEPTASIGGFGCDLPTEDAGQSCEQNSDCESFCLADSKTCAPRNYSSGCFDVFPEPNTPIGLCIN